MFEFRPKKNRLNSSIVQARAPYVDTKLRDIMLVPKRAQGQVCDWTSVCCDLRHDGMEGYKD